MARLEHSLCLIPYAFLVFSFTVIFSTFNCKYVFCITFYRWLDSNPQYRMPYLFNDQMSCPVRPKKVSSRTFVAIFSTFNFSLITIFISETIFIPKFLWMFLWISEAPFVSSEVVFGIGGSAAKGAKFWSTNSVVRSSFVYLDNFWEETTVLAVSRNDKGVTTSFEKKDIRWPSNLGPVLLTGAAKTKRLLIELKTD